MNAAREQFFNSAHMIRFLQNLGAHMAFVAPGARCAPLYHAMKYLGLRMCSVIDERALAFEALGWACAKGRPAIMACTSGSAVAHFFPAIIEAYQSRLPLIVLTCDRPQRLRSSDENQTINQVGIFGQYTCFEQSLELYESQSLGHVLHSLALALEGQRRPVHINLAYDWPLLAEDIPIGPLPLPPLQVPSAERQNKGPSKNLKTLISRFKNPFVAIGPLYDWPKEELIFWAKQSDVPFYADITSEIKTEVSSLAHSVTSLDGPFVLDYLASKVDGILHLGGPIISKTMEECSMDSNAQRSYNFHLFLPNTFYQIVLPITKNSRPCP